MNILYESSFSVQLRVSQFFSTLKLLSESIQEHFRHCAKKPTLPVSHFPLPPKPQLQANNLLQSLQAYLFLSVLGANHVMGPPYWLLSLSMFSKFIHVVVCVSTYFFLLVSAPFMENITFTHPSDDGICFHLLHQYKQRCCENTWAKWFFFFFLLDIVIQDLRCGVKQKLTDCFPSGCPASTFSRSKLPRSSRFPTSLPTLVTFLARCPSQSVAVSRDAGWHLPNGC